MIADEFTSTRHRLPDGKYQFNFQFASGKKIVFSCYAGEEFTQLNWKMAGHSGTSPELIKARAVQVDREEELRRQAVLERPELDSEPEFHYSRIAEYRSPGEDEPMKKPSGLSIGERKRLARLQALPKY